MNEHHQPFEEIKLIMHHRPTMADTTEVQTLDTFFKPHSTMT